MATLSLDTRDSLALSAQRGGDGEALLSACKPLLLRLLSSLRRQYGPFEAEASEEALHVGRIALWEALLRWVPTRSSFARFGGRRAYRAMRSSVLGDEEPTAPLGEAEIPVYDVYAEIEGPDDITGWILSEVEAVLTERQRQVFALWREGYGPSRIAEQLGLKPSKVSGCVGAIKRKAGRLRLMEVSE